MKAGRILPAAALALLSPAVPALADMLPGELEPEQAVWRAALGNEAYTSPVIAGGKVFVGTNNAKPRDPKITGDRGVLMAFDAETGAFLWQRTHAKLASGRINDWPHQGVCTAPAVEGERLYYVSNRGELLCLEVEDGTVAWSLDMVGDLGVHPHHMSVSTPLIAGERLFVGTSHGVDEKGEVPNPGAPSFLAVDKGSGEVLWRDASPGAKIVDGAWSSPSYGTFAGREQVLFPGGDGWLYSFDPATGKQLWRFDTSPDKPENLIAPAIVDPEHGLVYAVTGHDPELGAGNGVLYAIDPTGSGDVTASHVEWSYAPKNLSAVLGAPALHDGLLYVADLNGFLHCLEAKSGKALWTYDAFAAMWAGPLVADGKVYVVDTDGDVAVLAAGREKKLLAESNLGDAIYATPTAPGGAGGKLYVATRSTLFAFEKTP